MKIDILKKEEITILQISGNLDAESVAAFKKTAGKIVEEGCTHLILDCKALEFIDSMGLGAIISLLRKVRSQQGDIKIAALSPDVRSVFEITRLHRLFEITPDMESAYQKF